MLCALAEKEDHRKVSSSLITGNTALSLDKNDFQPLAIVTDNLLYRHVNNGMYDGIAKLIFMV